MNYGYAFIEFYVSLVTYTVMHMIFVISSDFVEAFNIPPLNIGIYVDKLAAIRALLMVIADVVEWRSTKKDYSMMKALTDSYVKNNLKDGQGCRRIASLLSFLAMLICRIVYLRLLYKSDNKSLSVFITLCIEGFWFGTFQMSFFAIGPEYNAFTSLGIHTMGNFIFFFQLILQRKAKSEPKINSLYRVRVHGWICLITSILALCLWLGFCVGVTASGEDAPSQWPNDNDVWSPFWLFIIGAFAEDFSVPGILPFAFLDPEKANLVNYLTPVFFMTGAMMTVFFNDGIKNYSKYKDWSASINVQKADSNDSGMYWHSLWLLNIPKYIAFFIAMWSVHGTFGDLRCIIQSRWRVLILTMNVVVFRATLETSGYVGVANYAIGRSDLLLGELAPELKKKSVTEFPVNADKLKSAIGESAGGSAEVQKAIAELVNTLCGATVKEESGGKKQIIASNGETSDPGNEKLKVILSGNGIETGNGTSEEPVVKSSSGGNGVKVTITIDDSNIGSLKPTGGGSNDDAAKEIMKKLIDAINVAKRQSSAGIEAKRDWGAFDYIAYHDILAMFCRFVYGKFAVGYNWTTI